MNTGGVLRLTSILLLSGAALSLLGAPLYTYRTIPGGTGLGLGENGYVTGYLNNLHAFLYRDGVMQDLGLAFGRHMTYGRAVNSHGHIAGAAVNSGPSDGLAFVYRDGQYHELPTSGGLGAFAEAMDINDMGWVVGYSGVPFVFRGFVYKDGVMHDLGAEHPDFINNAGQYSDYPINEHGSTVFYRDELGVAVLTRDGTETVIGKPGFSSFATNLNDQHDVVGTNCRVGDGTACHAFFWRDGIMYNLTVLAGIPGLRLIQASQINNAGQILARTSDGRSVLLTPVPGQSTLPAPVPEPSTFWLPVIASAIICGFHRKRHAKAASRKAADAYSR